MKKIFNNSGVEYVSPALEVLDVMVENGFANSLQFGNGGDAGQPGNYEDYNGGGF